MATPLTITVEYLTSSSTSTTTTQLLEQALAVEEQLHRASSAGLVQDPNHTVMHLHSKYASSTSLTHITPSQAAP